MKKKGFTVLEAVISFSIFLVVFIPLLLNTRILQRLDSSVLKGNDGNDGEIVQDYAGDVLHEFLQMAERAGFTFMDKTLGNSATTTKSYTMKWVNNSTAVSASGCTIDQYYLAENDVLTIDPYTEKKRCFSRGMSTDPGQLEGMKISLTLNKGSVINLTTLPNSDLSALESASAKSPSFIHLEAGLGGNFNDIILTPFQDLCVIN